MRTNILRSAAIALGICVCGSAQAQYGGYGSSPANANNAQPQNGFSADGYQQLGNTPAPGYFQPPAYATQSPQGFGGQQANTVPIHPSLQRTPATGSAGVQVSSQPAEQFKQQPAFQPQLGSPQGTGFPPNPYHSVGVDGGSLLSDPPIGSGHAPPPIPIPTPLTGHPGAEYVQPGFAGQGHAGSGSAANQGVGQMYMDAANAPWIGSEPIGAPCGPAPVFNPAVPIRPWFAGANLLFFNLENESNQKLGFVDAMPSRSVVNTNQVDPGSALGFETFFGRYFGCGKYAIAGSYFFFNPDQEEQIITPPMAGDYRIAMPLWDRLVIDRDGDGLPDDLGAPGPGDDHIYGGMDAAAAYRIRRDIDIQGFEVNFFSFGIGGAGRAGFGPGCGAGGGLCGPQGGSGLCFQPGCGGLGGPLVPACNSRCQFMVSHGVRWFQFRDQFELAASLMPNGFGAGDDDYYYNLDVQNDLLGYQFGSRLNYCVSRRVNLYAGGKFGLYGNNVDYHHRIGTRGATATVGPYYPTMTGEAMDINRNRTVLSTLGELDLGVGIRLTNCWTVTGGYRVLGVSGIATSIGSIAADPAHTGDGHLQSVDDSLLLHGGYVGVAYNW